MNILKDLVKHFLYEVNFHFIHDSESDMNKFAPNSKEGKKFLTEKYNKEIWLCLDNFFDVKEENRFWEWSNSKEVTTTEIKGDEPEIPVMTNLIKFLNKHYSGLSQEDILTITSSCKCTKTIRPDYREYHNFYCKYERGISLYELSGELTAIFSQTNKPIEFIDINKIIKQFSMIIPTMKMEEYKAFSMQESLSEILEVKSEKNHKIKI